MTDEEFQDVKRQIAECSAQIQETFGEKGRPGEAFCIHDGYERASDKRKYLSALYKSAILHGRLDGAGRKPWE